MVDANKQAIAYVCGHAGKRDTQVARGLTLDEARRIASNIAKLPTLLGKERVESVRFATPWLGRDLWHPRLAA